MRSFQPIREIPKTDNWGPEDALVVFGELFSRGYANGIVDEAKKRGMKIIYSTVGRRDSEGQLRPLNNEELAEKDSPLINIPLEAGFDMEPDSNGQSPVDQLKGAKLSEWDKLKMDWESLEESRKNGVQRFRNSVEAYLEELEPQLAGKKNVLFVHTMAGGVPRAKIAMPALNRVFKGYGDRYASSEEFWSSDLGRFCEASFEEVTANTLNHLIDLSAGLRERITDQGGQVSYVAYGYHGTEVLMGGEYQWQSYSPYLQGFAKLQLEEIAKEAWAQDIRVSVFNSPEILTNSSSIFLGVEVSLYPLLGAIEKEVGQDRKAQEFLKSCLGLLKEVHSLEEILSYTHQYFSSDVIQQWSQFKEWPQHNGPEQMQKMRESSRHLIEMHEDEKKLITAELSELVFRATGLVMIREAAQPIGPVRWVGHDIVAKLAPKCL